MSTVLDPPAADGAPEAAYAPISVERSTGPGPHTSPDPELAPAPAPDEAAGRPPAERPWPPRRIALQALGWLAVLVAATFLVAYPLGPVLQHREQHHLLRSFRTDIVHAANDDQGLAGLIDKTPEAAPRTGQPVAIVDIGDLHLRQVVVEGTSAASTARGPGHLAGSAGLGQPGNAVVVGRRAAWGGPFASLRTLQPGQLIVTSTTQGQSVYRVTSVRTKKLRRGDTGPTDDDQLTLITSASAWPSTSTEAVVVRAKLMGTPFEPTTQGTRPAGTVGHLGDSDGTDRLVLCVLVFALAAVGAVRAHRMWKPLVAHLLTTPALVVLAVITAEAATRLLPAWS